MMSSVFSPLSHLGRHGMQRAAGERWARSWVPPVFASSSGHSRAEEATPASQSDGQMANTTQRFVPGHPLSPRSFLPHEPITGVRATVKGRFSAWEHTRNEVRHEDGNKRCSTGGKANKCHIETPSLGPGDAARRGGHGRIRGLQTEPLPYLQGEKHSWRPEENKVDITLGTLPGQSGTVLVQSYLQGSNIPIRADQSRNTEVSNTSHES